MAFLRFFERAEVIDLAGELASFGRKLQRLAIGGHERGGGDAAFAGHQRGPQRGGRVTQRRDQSQAGDYHPAFTCFCVHRTI